MGTPSKRKRTELCLEDKVKLIKDSPGKSQRQLAEQYGIGKTQGCPDGWMLLLDSCYHLYNTSVDWDTARNYCMGVGSDLVALSTEQEQHTVMGYYNSTRHPIWLGAVYDAELESWSWVNGEDWSFDYFDNTTIANVDERAAIRKQGTSPERQWFMVKATVTKIVLCERKA